MNANPNSLEVAPKTVIAVSGASPIATPWTSDTVLSVIEEDDSWSAFLTTEGIFVHVRTSEVVMVVDVSATNHDRESRLAEFQPASSGVIVPSPSIITP